MLPSSILYQCIQVSFDVMDIIANNSVENNKKIALDTSVIREETLVFNCIQGSLNLTKNDVIADMLKTVPENKRVQVFCVCLIQGLLQSRQNLTCGGQQKWIPWGVSCIAQCLTEILNLASEDLSKLADNLVKVIMIFNTVIA